MNKPQTTARYGVSAFISVCLFAAINYLHWSRSTDIACGCPYGLPFTFFRDGGFGGGSKIIWAGVWGDLIAFTAALALSWRLLFSRRSNPEGQQCSCHQPRGEFGNGRKLGRQGRGT
jgi:hypothetical protein